MKYWILIIIVAVLSVSHAQEIKWGEAQNLTILNSEEDEFAPVWNYFQKTLYYNSNKSGYSLFYQSNFENETYSKSVLVKGGINRNRNNQSYITFESKTTAYLSTFRQFTDRSYLNIFQTRRKKDQWLEAFEIDSLNLPCFMGHPTVSKDGNFLVFSTDYNSEFNDTDLWMAVKQDNDTWGTLIRLSNLKTPGNEITPCLHGNDTLYFASDGQEGPGGYDVFISTKENGIWQMPFPVIEINTEFDESDFTRLPNEKAVFASNRPGGLGGLDLYLIEKIKEEDIETSLPQVEFTIATQVPGVKVESQSLSRNVLINAVYPFNTEYFNENSDFHSILFEKSFDIISERIKNIKDDYLVCTVYSTELDENRKNEINSFIESKLQLSRPKLLINFAAPTLNMKDIFSENDILLKIFSNSMNTFATEQYQEHSKIKLYPPALDITLDARPRNLISNWSLSIKSGSSEEIQIKASNQLPSHFYFKLYDLKNELAINDSLNLILKAKDENLNEFYHNETLAVTHSTIETNDYKNIDGKKYEVYHLFVTDWFDLTDNSAFTSTFRAIAQRSAKNNILIHYFNEKSIINAEKVKENLINQIGGSKLNAQIKQTKPYDYFDNLISLSLLEILVEV